jgi:hypothetical protein
MFTAVLLALLGQCGPGGCTIISDSGWRPAQVVRAVEMRPTTFDIVVVPPDGRVRFDGELVVLENGRGRVSTRPLQVGRRYQYHVTVRWGDIERSWTVQFSPGQTVNLLLWRDDPAFSLPVNKQSASATSQTMGASSLPATGNTSQSPQASAPANTTVAARRESESNTERSNQSHVPSEVLHSATVDKDGIANFGIDRASLSHGTERITLDGQPITRGKAVQMLQANGLVDDSGKLRLTIIGPDADRRRVIEDLKGPLRDIADQCLVQDYPPDHWAVARVGFYTGGRPTIYIQAPDGTVLHRQDDYKDGPEGLRRAFLRLPNPFYRPDRDRDLRRGNDILTWLWDTLVKPFYDIIAWWWAGVIALVLMIVTRRGWARYVWYILVNLVPEAPAPKTRKLYRSGTRVQLPSSTKPRKKK